MCGICGVLTFRDDTCSVADPVAKMTLAMRHRGPDDEGYMLAWCGSGPAECYAGDDTVRFDGAAGPPEYYPREHVRDVGTTDARAGLGHRRLSILDLSPLGRQPMCTPDRRYWIVYNGEIYNYRDLAERLEREGVAFLGRSDTEVLVHAYARWGPEFLDSLNGMFALAIWDDAKKELFCARDRIGIKPFYFYRTDAFFVFASDIKTIISSGLYRPEVDPEGLYHCMSFGVAPRPMTAFKGIRALEQGCRMLVSAEGKTQTARYWRLPVGTQDRSMSEEEAVALLEDRLSLSVKRRLIADVDVGTFMSGGIDSTTISAMAAAHHPGIQAFTLTFEGPDREMDELHQAKATAGMYPMTHNVRVVSAERGLESINAAIRCYEEPFYSLAPNYIISEFVADHGLKVILNGLGGDELFCGYWYYRWAGPWKLLRRLRLPLRLIGRLGPLWERACRVSAVETADMLHTVLFSVTTEEQKRRLFRDPSVRDFDTVERLRRLYVPDGITFSDPIEAMSYMDILNYIGNHHLYRVDQFTMHFSIEGRFPFLDHELVEAAFRIPSRHKLRSGKGKHVLRQVAKRRIHPSCLAMGKKGFALPVGRWMGKELKALAAEKIRVLEQRDIFTASEVRRIHEMFERGDAPYHRLWQLVAVELWLEEFF